MKINVPLNQDLKGGGESASAGDTATVLVSRKPEESENNPKQTEYDGTPADKRSATLVDNAFRVSDHVCPQLQLHRLSSVPAIRKTFITDSTALFQDAGKSLQFLCTRGRARV
jgi:hypothetical protein